MLYNYKISRAIQFATKTHEVYQKQKRKGKDIPYITHPLTVGLILSRAGADEDTIVAGILHDTIEDSTLEKKVSAEMLAKRFGDNVANLVISVTELYKALSWEDRKKTALNKIISYSHESLLIKSADTISNLTELIDDYKNDGESVFERFGAPKGVLLQNHLRVVTAIIDRWSENPLAEDLKWVARELQSIGAAQFMSQYHAEIVEYADYSENMPLECPVCGWRGMPKTSGWINTDSHFALDVSCPNCEKMLLVASY